MLSANLKAPVVRIITPACRALLSVGITPNVITTIGALSSIASSLLLIARGHLFAGVIMNIFFVLFDLLDGTMARLSGGGTRWGAVLDSTFDRITDAVLLASLILYLHSKHDRLLPVVMCGLIGGFLVSYVRAKAESFDIACSIGIAERTERLIVALLGMGLAGLGLPYALSISMWILAIISLVTVAQRLALVFKASKDISV